MRLTTTPWPGRYNISILLVLSLIGAGLYLFFFTAVFPFIWYYLSPAQTDRCVPPCETDVQQHASIQLTGTLIDYQTASIGITSLFGANHGSETYYVALWQGYQPGKWEDALHIRTIKKGALSMVLLDGLNINKLFNYTIGLAIQDGKDTTYGRVCAMLTIPAGICPPKSLPATSSGICVKARYARSILLDYWTPDYHPIQKDQPWISVFSGGISPQPFTRGELIGYHFLGPGDNSRSLILSDLNLQRLTTYTVAYGLGISGDSIPSYAHAIAATSFKTE